ncbi:MAG: response regulator transcription factor [Candidatus Omnitrophica bacterium]|nr:response regulator transcription factor [Candidatus Omnitrophota bacterium]
MRANKILIVDDHKEFRKTLRSFIERQFKGIEIAEAATAEQGVVAARKNKPEIALVDIHLPRMGGMEALRQIKQYAPSCHILTMSLFKENRCREFLSEEVEAFIWKDEIADELIPLFHRLLI